MSSAKRYFKDIDIKELIHQYRQYDCLWNYFSPQYKSKALKQEAWEEIANYFQKDASEVKRKIKYLRSAYVAERGRVIAKKKANPDTLYRPSLFYYNELAFLDSIVVLRKFENDSASMSLEFENTTVSHDSEDQDYFGEEESIGHKTEIKCKVENFAEPEIEIPLSPQIDTPQISSARSLTARPIKRKVTGQNKLHRSMSTNASSSSCKRKARCKDVYVSFGRTIALQLQQIPLETAILAMSEIQTILTKKTLEHIKTQSKGDESRSASEESCSEIEEYFNDSTSHE